MKRASTERRTGAGFFYLAAFARLSLSDRRSKEKLMSSSIVISTRRKRDVIGHG